MNQYNSKRPIFPQETTATTTNTTIHPLVAVLCLSIFPLIYFVGKMIVSFAG